MPKALNLMDAAFFQILNDGSKLLNKEFVMGIFSPIVSRVTLLHDYLEYMF